MIHSDTFQLARVGHICTTVLGKMLQTVPKSPRDQEVPYLRAGLLEALSDLPELPAMFAGASEVQVYRVREGDLLVAEGGDVGRSEFAPRLPDRTIFQNSLHRVYLRNDGDLRYVRYALASIHSSGWLDVMCNKATFGHLTVEKLRQLHIPWPRPSAQRAIAGYLDIETGRIDALISKKRRMIELLEERWTELRRDKILRGLDPVRGGGLAEPWDEMNLGVLIELQRGHDLPGDDRIEGDIPVVSSGGVSGSHNIAIADGPGVVTGRYGTIGEVFFVDEPYWPLNTTLYVKDFRGNHPQWVCHLLASIPLDIDSQKSAVGGINRNIVGSLRVPRPPVPVQRAIADDLNDAEGVSKETHRKLEAQIHLLVERRKALITAAVTGELLVPGVAA